MSIQTMSIQTLSVVYVAMRNCKKIFIHIAYWLFLVLFFTIAWGIYDHQYFRNFMVQVLSLPSRLMLVYGILYYLIPKTFKKKNYFLFFLGLMLLIACTGLIQRTIIIFTVEGNFLPYHSDYFFKLHELMNTIIDVVIAAIIPITYVFYQFWLESQKSITELSQKLNELDLVNSKYIILKEGNINHKINLSEILYIESLRNYFKVQFATKAFKSYGSLSTIEKNLPSEKFIRIQRSFIVNIDYLQNYSSKFVEVGGKKISIGRKFKENLSKALADKTNTNSGR